MDFAAPPELEEAQAEDADAENEPVVRPSEISDLPGPQVGDEDEKPAGFVISTSMRGKCRRLHFAGGCFRFAGEHFKLYE